MKIAECIQRLDHGARSQVNLNLNEEKNFRTILNFLFLAPILSPVFIHEKCQSLMFFTVFSGSNIDAFFMS